MQVDRERVYRHVLAKLVPLPKLLKKWLGIESGRKGVHWSREKLDRRDYATFCAAMSFALEAEAPKRMSTRALVDNLFRGVVRDFQKMVRCARWKRKNVKVEFRPYRDIFFATITGRKLVLLAT